MRRVLNVGGGNKQIPLPEHYSGWEHVLLDIDPQGGADVVLDARALAGLPARQYDAVYCSHNLEHYHRHDAPKVLAGFRHVLADGGFVEIRVPDLDAVFRAMLERGLGLEDVLYESPAGPISVLDVIYGWGVEIERSGHDFYAHRNGFTRASLSALLARCGFGTVYAATGNFEVVAFAFVGLPAPYAVELLGLPD